MVQAVSPNIDKAFILQPSANIMVGDLAQNLAQFVDFPTRIPDRDHHQPYLLDLFLCSNPDSSTVAFYHPLGKSDHMVVSVDVKFEVKSIWASLSS